MKTATHMAALVRCLGTTLCLATFCLATGSLAAASLTDAATVEPTPTLPAAPVQSAQAVAKPPKRAGTAKQVPLHDGSFTGPSVNAYYGFVQVQANISSGHIMSVDVLKFPSDRRTSRSINAQALPMLQTEVITAQAAKVDIISGATLTSQAYMKSLNAALGLAAQ